MATSLLSKSLFRLAELLGPSLKTETAMSDLPFRVDGDAARITASERLATRKRVEKLIAESAKFFSHIDAVRAELDETLRMLRMRIAESKIVVQRFAERSATETDHQSD